MSDIPMNPRDLDEGPAYDDEVARLLQLAGHRPPVPQEDAAIIKEAARLEWRRKVKNQRRRAFTLRAGGLLAAAAALLLLVGPRYLWQGTAARLETVSGTLVSERFFFVSSALAAGDEVAARTTLETPPSAPSESPRAALRLRSGVSLRLDSNTRVRLISESVLDLERGAVYVDSDPSTNAGGIEIRTALGVARDVGTQFEVRYEADAPNGATLRLRVREGLVNLARDDGIRRAEAGVELTVHSDGTLVAGKVPLHGEPWGWILGVLPAFEINGRPVRDLLDWAAREAGWELRFEDDSAAAAASIVILQGSPIEGWTPEEALAALLPSSGLAYRLEDGVLWVSSVSSR